MYPPVLYFEEARSKQKARETRRITKTRETSIGPGYLIDVRCTCITISEHHTLRDAIQLQQLVFIPVLRCLQVNASTLVSYRPSEPEICPSEIYRIQQRCW